MSKDLAPSRKKTDFETPNPHLPWKICRLCTSQAPQNLWAETGSALRVHQPHGLSQRRMMDRWKLSKQDGLWPFGSIRSFQTGLFIINLTSKIIKTSRARQAHSSCRGIDLAQYHWATCASTCGYSPGRDTSENTTSVPRDGRHPWVPPVVNLRSPNWKLRLLRWGAHNWIAEVGLGLVAVSWFPISRGCLERLIFEKKTHHPTCRPKGEVNKSWALRTLRLVTCHTRKWCIPGTNQDFFWLTRLFSWVVCLQKKQFYTILSQLCSLTSNVIFETAELSRVKTGCSRHLYLYLHICRYMCVCVM